MFRYPNSHTGMLIYFGQSARLLTVTVSVRLNYAVVMLLTPENSSIWIHLKREKKWHILLILANLHSTTLKTTVLVYLLLV